jgi:hypothetical protein
LLLPTYVFDRAGTAPQRSSPPLPVRASAAQGFTAPVLRRATMVSVQSLPCCAGHVCPASAASSACACSGVRARCCAVVPADWSSSEQTHTLLSDNQFLIRFRYSQRPRAPRTRTAPPAPLSSLTAHALHRLSAPLAGRASVSHNLRRSLFLTPNPAVFLARSLIRNFFCSDRAGSANTSHSRAQQPASHRHLLWYHLRVFLCCPRARPSASHCHSPIASCLSCSWQQRRRSDHFLHRRCHARRSALILS